MSDRAIRRMEMKNGIKFILVSFMLWLGNAKGETVTYYVNDLSGSPVAAMDSTGNVLWKESYNPFGEGMQARYYDPVIGRFYGIDPVGFEDQNPMTFNRYSYVNNNPYKYVDPNGESAALAYCFGGPVGCLIGIAVTIVVADYTIGAVNDNYGGGSSDSLPDPLTPVRSESSSEDSDGDSFDTENPNTSNPIEGEPGSCSECNNSKGKKKQRRYYGEDGYPNKDIDYDHAHGNGDDNSGSPHAHDWDRPADGSPPTHKNRGPARQPEPDEIEDRR
jgi:RHS repeat-associated protein